MSVGTIARKDLADASRSKMLWVVAVLVLLSTAGVTGLVAATSGMPAREVFGLAFQLAVTTLPIIALILAVILGPQAETMFLRTLSLGGVSLIESDPLFAALVALVALSAISTLLPIKRIGKKVWRST